MGARASRLGLERRLRGRVLAGPAATRGLRRPEVDGAGGAADLQLLPQRFSRRGKPAPDACVVSPSPGPSFPACPGATRWMYPMYSCSSAARWPVALLARASFSGMVSNVGIPSTSWYDRPHGAAGPWAGRIAPGEFRRRPQAGGEEAVEFPSPLRGSCPRIGWPPTVTNGDDLMLALAMKIVSGRRTTPRPWRRCWPGPGTPWPTATGTRWTRGGGSSSREPWSASGSDSIL